jgi:pilus assembly protein Flp/PilA
MSNLITTELKRFVREEEGTEVVEWALVGGLIVAVGAAIFAAIGTRASVYLNQLLTALGGTAT